MKKIILLSIISLSSFSIFSQANNAAYNLISRQIDLEEEDAAFGLTQAQYNSTVGSPYSNKDFIQGVIYKDGKIVQSEVLMRYNIFSDEIEIKNEIDEKEYGALIKDPNVFVKIFQDNYVYSPFEGSNENGHYFKVVNEFNNFDLYKKTEVNYNPPYYAKTSYDRNKSAEFIQTNTYYLVSKKGAFYELPNSKSKIIKVMGKKEKEIKSFIKEQKIDLKNEKDLIKLVKYYNSLL